MKKIYLIALLCLVGLSVTVVSCSKSKADHIIDGFEELVEEVENQKGDLTIEEWKKIEADFNRRFEELGINDIDEKEFSALQKIELAALMVRWTAAIANSTPALMESSIEAVQEEAEKETLAETNAETEN